MPIHVATVRDPQSAEYLKAVALKETDPARALSLWQAARRFDPENVGVLAHEALALLEARRFEPAIRALSEAVPQHPRHPHLINLLGVALFEAGHAADALRLFEHLLSLDPEYPPALASRDNARRALARSRPAPAPVRAAIDRTLAEAARRPRPTLSACLIVKNEAEFLAGAIESVRGVADEVVVVDTGSTDETEALARAAGARVGRFPWIGDFAAARNASIELATGDWILVIDADERLSAESRSSLRAILEEEQDPHRVICVKIRNYTRSGRFLNEGFSGRLFRNVPEMRFKGRVHEEVGRDVPDASTDYRLDVVFDHYGADPDVMREKDKDQRNVELLEARLRENPDDLLTWFYLGSQHWVAGRWVEARDAFERVIELFERNPGAYGMAVRHVPVPYSYVGAVRGRINLSQAAEALDLADRALARFPDNPDLWYHTAFAHIALGDLPAARRALERSLAIEPSGYALIGMHDPAIRAWRAEKVLGDIDYEGGDRAAAYPRYARVAPAIPVHQEDAITVAARLVELACELGDLDAAPDHTVRYLTLRPTEHAVGLQVAGLLAERRGLQAAYDLLTRLHGEVEPLRAVPDVALAVGRVAEQAGEDQEALRWYEQAMALGHQEPGFFVNLARLFLRLGQHEAAGEAARLARTLMGRG